MARQFDPQLVEPYKAFQWKGCYIHSFLFYLEDDPFPQKAAGKRQPSIVGIRRKGKR